MKQKKPTYEELERKVEELRETEDSFRSIAENASDGVLVAAGEGMYVYANRRAARITGYAIDELLRMGIRDLAHPDEVEGILRRFGKRMRGEKTQRQYETRIVRKDGATVPVEITGSRTVWKGTASVLSILRDITHRLQMEKDLRSSEERFRAIFEGSLDAIFLADPDTGRILDANPAAEELLLRDQDEIAGLHYLELYPPWRRERYEKAYKTLLEEGEQTKPLTAEMLRSDGTVVPVEALAQLIQIDGVPVVHGVVRDISERRRMDQELRDSEEQFRTLAEASLAGIFIYQDGKFVYVNPALARIFGYECREMIGKMGPIELTHPEDREAANEHARQCLQEHERAPVLFSFRCLRRDGQLIRCEVLQGVARHRGRRALIGTLLDVTGRKRMEEELLKTQKLESLGVLAGGIAHDFNNILTAISTNISMARLYGNLEDDIAQMMEDAEKASIRARNLTQQLLAFARGGAPVRKSVSILKVLRENTEFALSGSNVKCEDFSDLDANKVWQVEADEGQIGQVIHNLIINAMQAMPEGGILEVGAENIPAERVRSIPLKPRDYVGISIVDQGIGIPGRHLQKIFDPFFTTKQKGSGLGLTTSFTIVKNHEGHIEVDSEVGVGTTVRVYLPASDRGTASLEPKKEELSRGRGRVLIIDDEGIIRKSASEALRRLGYDVALAEEGGEGVRLYREAFQGEEPFDLVLLDLTIPGGTGGEETVRELLRLDPDAKVIASSGYSNDPVMANYREYGFRDVIIKPYRIDDLGKVLHKVMTE